MLAAALLAAATAAPSPTGPVYAGNPAVRMSIESRPLGFDPDGNANWLAVAHFFDAQGQPTRILANSDLDWISHDGYVQWQTRMRYGQPAAIVKGTRDGLMTLIVRVNLPKLGGAIVQTDTRAWSGPRIVGEALGPHTIAIGWFPQEPKLVRIIRIDGQGHRSEIAIIAGRSSSYRDTTVEAGKSYRYEVHPSRGRSVGLLPIATPALPPVTRLKNAAGKAMWLYFTTNPLDPIYYQNLRPQAIVDQAVAAGLHYVELRTAYGAYWEIEPQVKPTIDAIVDGLAAHGIGTIGWIVPRDTSFEDLQNGVRTAYYRTANGTPLTGVAVDLERGEEFMGGDPKGLAALWRYMQILRGSLGSPYLLIATVEDPNLEHLDNAKYPFRSIANYSDVLQPMTYWRMLRHGQTTPAQVKAIVQASYETLRRETGRVLPVSIGGQTAPVGPNGAPPPQEIVASLDAVKRAGAIGECFFDWDGTQPDQWDALAGYRW